MITPEKRRTIIVLIIVLLFLIFFFTGFFLLTRSTDSPASLRGAEGDEAISVTEEQMLESEKNNQETRLEQEQAERNETSNVTSLSKTFVERYGSYSTEANFQNLRDVLPLMTSSFAARTEQFISTAKTPSEYYGVSTDVITVNVEVMEEDESAIVLITTQREEAKGLPGNVSIKYQDVRVEYLFESGSWKVNSADWL